MLCLVFATWLRGRLAASGHVGNLSLPRGFQCEPTILTLHQVRSVFQGQVVRRREKSVYDSSQQRYRFDESEEKLQSAGWFEAGESHYDYEDPMLQVYVFVCGVSN